MGVLPNRRKVLFEPGSSWENTNSSGDEGPLGYHFDDSDGDVEREQNPRPRRPSPRVKKFLPLAGTSLKLKKGRRSKHRYENERNLFASVEMDPDEAPEGWDIAHETSSHFTQLLDGTNRKLLETFLNLDDDKCGGHLEKRNVLNTDDNAETCFLRISNHLRQALKKHLPMGMLENLEERIREHFITKPSEHFIASDYTSYERLLAHICSMYNRLNSCSYNEDGVRKLKIVNPRCKFDPIDPSLSQYLSTRSA